VPASGGLRATRTKLAPNIARGLLNGPAESGRTPSAPAEHVVRLERIKLLQADGHTLLGIGRILSEPAAAKSAMDPPTAWWQHGIADDVIVWLRDGASPWANEANPRSG
jgi:hypothetical protein